MLSLGLSVALNWVLSPLSGIGEDPGAVIVAESEQDAAFAAALKAADDPQRPDPGPLTGLLQAMPDAQRQRIALAWLLASERGSAALGLPADNTAALWRMRYRLLPFAQVATGRHEIDQALDNLLAYVLAAGTMQPSEADLAVLRGLLPRLLAQVAKDDEQRLWPVWDTIGCVHARLGDWPSARNAFAHAVRGAEADGDWPRSGTAGARAGHRQAILGLFRARLAAAEQAKAGGTPTLPVEPSALAATAAKAPSPAR